MITSMNAVPKAGPERPTPGPPHPATTPAEAGAALALPGSRAPAALRVFLSAAVLRPGTVGAVWPSSRRLAMVLTSVVPASDRPVVVELGPGTGAVSKVIAQRLPVGGRHLAVELDDAMAGSLSRRLPESEVIVGDASQLRILLAGRQVPAVDAVVCGLPWALFTPATQRTILGEVGAVLAPGGAFTTFAYRHAAPLRRARAFRRTLSEMFEDVVVSGTVWLNTPPAFVYVCRKPVSAG